MWGQIHKRYPQSSIIKICFKIICLKFHSNFPVAIELRIWAHASHKGTTKRSTAKICAYFMGYTPGWTTVPPVRDTIAPWLYESLYLKPHEVHNLSCRLFVFDFYYLGLVSIKSTSFLYLDIGIPISKIRRSGDGLIFIMVFSPQQYQHESSIWTFTLIHFLFFFSLVYNSFLCIPSYN